MRRWTSSLLQVVVVLGIAMVAGTLHFVRPVRAEPVEWHRVRTGALARIQAERALYELEGHRHFFVRIHVSNRSPRPLGVDASDYDRFIRPNQWGGLRRPVRGEINEERQVPGADDLREGGGQRLRDDFRAGRLIEIQPGASRDFYVEFNASGRADVDATDTPFLFVSLDGQLLVTDGVGAEQITLEVGRVLRPDEDLDSDLILEAPFRWRIVPPGAVVVLSR